MQIVCNLANTVPDASLKWIPPRQRKQIFHVQFGGIRHDQHAFCFDFTRARRERNGKRSRVRFRLSLAAPLRRTASLMPFRRPPVAFRRQRQTEAGAKLKLVVGIGHKPTGAGKTKFAGILTTRMESAVGNHLRVWLYGEKTRVHPSIKINWVVSK
jgi:hypothetical protein